MEKFNYKISIEAPSKQIADMLIDFICKDNIEVLQMMKHNTEEEKKETKIKEPELHKPNEKEKFLKGLMDFDKVVQIVGRCVMDETAIDQIAFLLGIDVKPEKTQQP